MQKGNSKETLYKDLFRHFMPADSLRGNEIELGYRELESIAEQRLELGRADSRRFPLPLSISAFRSERELL
jgi:hypothetical protein